MKQAIVDKVHPVSSAALVSSLVSVYSLGWKIILGILKF